VIRIAVPVSGRAIIRSRQYNVGRVSMGRRRTVVEIQPGGMPGESDSADVDLAETEPWENDGSGDDALEPESSVVFASMGQGLAWFAVVVDKENDLGPDQSQSGPSEETVSPLKGVVELVTQTGVGEDEHHQKEAQDNPGNDDGGKRDLC
jgi:hypothetical protein